MSGTACYRVPLTCTRCGTRVAAADSRLWTRAIVLYAHDIWLEPGHRLLIGPDDLADAFTPVSRWPVPHPLQALEAWTCPVCGSAQAALLVWSDEGAAGWQLVSVSGVTITPELLRQVDGVSQRVTEVLAVEHAAILAARRIERDGGTSGRRG